MSSTFISLDLCGPHHSPRARQGRDDHVHCSWKRGSERRIRCSRSQTRGRIGAGTQVSVTIQQACGKYLPCARSCAGFRDTRMNQKSTWLLGSKAQQKSQEYTGNYTAIYNYICQDSFSSSDRNPTQTRLNINGIYWFT